MTQRLKVGIGFYRHADIPLHQQIDNANRAVDHSIANHPPLSTGKLTIDVTDEAITAHRLVTMPDEFELHRCGNACG